METLADGAGGVVILAGPSGMGKSALLDELAHRSGATGSEVAQVSEWTLRLWLLYRNKFR